MINGYLTVTLIGDLKQREERVEVLDRRNAFEGYVRIFMDVTDEQTFLAYRHVSQKPCG